MRIGSKLILSIGLGLSLAPSAARAQDTNKPSAFKDDREKASYGVGMWLGNMIKRSNMDLDLDVVMGATRDVVGGKETKLSEMEGQKAIRDYQQVAQKKIAEKNKKEGESFLAENKKKPGIQTIEVTRPDGTHELQYKIITEGTGPTPKSNDLVSVNYKGTLVSGKEFDSSAKHGGQPAKFMVNRVVPGWTEALERMKVGSKWELYIPSALGYGDMPPPGSGIEPGSTLIFEVELVSIDAPPAAPAPQPLTSDIIKVPSADELKKGAKIEVIKPEDAARMAAEAQTNGAKPKQ